MKIHVKESDSYKYEVKDLSTNKPIRGVQYADDEKGIYEVVLYENGFPKLCPCCSHYITDLKRGNIKIVKKEVM